MQEAYIIDGIRTPIGNFTGTLSTIRTDDLGAHVIAELVKRNPNIPTNAYADVIMGCAMQWDVFAWKTYSCVRPREIV